MNDFRNKLARFMYGRYGIDQLYRSIIGVDIALMVINLFVGSLIISTVIWILFFIAFFRAFSKNIYKRRAENDKYLKLIAPIKKSLIFKRIRDFRIFRYRKCPKCGQILRLKRKTGKHSVVCPKCGEKIEVRIWL